MVELKLDQVFSFRNVGTFWVKHELPLRLPTTSKKVNFEQQLFHRPAKNCDFELIRLRNLNIYNWKGKNIFFRMSLSIGNMDLGLFGVGLVALL